MKNRESERTVVTLANGVNLVAQVVRRVVGDEVADMYDGASLTLDVTQRLAAVKFKSELTDYLGK